MNLKKRLYSTMIGAIVAIVFLLYSSIRLFTVVSSAIAIMGFIEFLNIFNTKKHSLFYYSSIAIGICEILSFSMPRLWYVNYGIVFVVLLYLTISAVLYEKFSIGFENVAIVFGAGIYIALFLYFILLLRFLPDGRDLLFTLCFTTWGRDVGAFLFGKKIKYGHVMLPAVSEKKTYEGAVFGIICAIAIVRICSHWFSFGLTMQEIILIGFFMGVFGQLGDLIESWIKRSAHVTDSSHIIPGQGGILDTFDSFVFTAPLMYMFISIFSF